MATQKDVMRPAYSVRKVNSWRQVLGTLLTLNRLHETNIDRQIAKAENQIE